MQKLNKIDMLYNEKIYFNNRSEYFIDCDILRSRKIEFYND